LTGEFLFRQGKKCKKHGGFPTEVSDMARNKKMELFTVSLNSDAFRIFSPKFFCGKYKSLKKQQQTDYFLKMAQRPSEYGNIEIISINKYKRNRRKRNKLK
jgi:hypothetical protein